MDRTDRRPLAAPSPQYPPHRGDTAGPIEPPHGGSTAVAPLPIHSDCDVAAVVYGPAVDPDPVLRGFFERRLGEGWDVVGVLQERLPLGDDARRRVRLHLAADGELVPATPPSWHARREALAAIGDRLVEVVDRRPDVLILNRFGRCEANGGGLFALIRRAVEIELPVLVAVPEALFPVWLACVRGLAVRVPPRRGALELWWRSLGFGPPLPAPRERACTFWK